MNRNTLSNNDAFARRLENAIDNPDKTFKKFAVAAIILNVLWVLFIAAVIIGGIVLVVSLI